MRHHGEMSGFVALLLLCGFGLLIAGSALAPDTLPTWLMGGGGVAIYWALNAYRTSARRQLDPRLSEREEVTS